jgi:predicted ATPase with chaperone activity
MSIFGARAKIELIGNGQAETKRALLIAAAGSHNIQMIGPLGTGKTLLAKRLPTILPPLTPAESLETTRIYSAMGLLKPGQPLMAVRPFRSPHHSVSDAGLVGGGTTPQPGEISLANKDVLFLDEAEWRAEWKGGMEGRNGQASQRRPFLGKRISSESVTQL